jgi:hypothetical protein
MWKIQVFNVSLDPFLKKDREFKFVFKCDTKSNNRREDIRLRRISIQCMNTA